MIEINNLSRSRIEEKFVRQICEQVLKGEEANNKNLSLAFVSGARIKELNWQYRQKKGLTDVLSFSEKEIPGWPKNREPFSFLGEIIICPEAVRKNARRLKNDFKKELARVVIHGLLHLSGYKHEGNEEEARRMRARENYYLLEKLAGVLK